MRLVRAVCPDWPVVAAGHRPDEPVLVVAANRVVACSPAARAEGAEPGQRRREAQGRCPSAVVIERDPDRDARAFAPVIALLDRYVPCVELSTPGSFAFPARGPSRLFGGDDALAASIAQDLDARLALDGWPGAIGIGIADGAFAAGLAARRAVGRAPVVVASGASAAFLAPFPIDALEQPELTDVLSRLGLRTLGALAALDAGSVLGRFGDAGRRAHRLALGLDDERVDATVPSRDRSVSLRVDPPAERSDTIAFLAREPAEHLHDALSGDGLACTRVLISFETEHGEQLERAWRHEGALSAAAVVDRVRWQLDGWLGGPPATRPTAGVVHLRLTPDGIVPAVGRQLGFWGAERGVDERAVRALTRVQALAGPSTVLVPEARGGRGPAERVVAVPFGGGERGAGRGGGTTRSAPWPGSVPGPAPAIVPSRPVPVELHDRSGRSIVVGGRGTISAEPATVVLDGRRCAVEAWAGPWSVDERWWDPTTRRRRARLQVVLDDGRALLLHVERAQWYVEGFHD